MKKVAFICVHNSCRSQIAEALGKHLASDVFESYSAGSEIKNQIVTDAKLYYKPEKILFKVYRCLLLQQQHRNKPSAHDRRLG